MKYEELKNLSKKDLINLRNKIDLLLKDEANETNEVIFYEVITTYLSNIMKSKFQYYSLFKKTSYYSNLKTTTKYVDSYCQELFGKVSKTERVKFYKLYIELIVEMIKKNKDLSLSIPLVLNYHEMFPGLLEKAFPGYIAGGLAKYILK